MHRIPQQARARGMTETDFSGSAGAPGEGLTAIRKEPRGALPVQPRGTVPKGSWPSRLPQEERKGSLYSDARQHQKVGRAPYFVATM